MPSKKDKTETKTKTKTLKTKSTNPRQPVIVWGKRTAFAKSFSLIRNMTALDLAVYAVREGLADCNLDYNEVDEVVFGQVVPGRDSVNIARDLVLRLGLPRRIPGYTLNRACASSLQAVTSAADMVASGNADVVIAGGAESLSNPPIWYSKEATDFLADISRARNMKSRINLLKKVSLKSFLPQAPSITEPFTGKTMGQHAEEMAKINGIKRDDQDKLALMSHQNAAKAWNDGIYEGEVTSVLSPDNPSALEADEGIRGDTSFEKLAKLKPVFDRKYGSVTAGNSSPLTDGASCIIVMSQEKADQLGFKPISKIKSYAYSALDPMDQLLLGPAYAIPRALEKAGISLKDCDYLDLHEAFAAQVLSNTQALGSKKFAEEKFGYSKAIGEVDFDKLNAFGGSISIGHPFGATGGRMVLTMSKALQRENKQFALLGICAAGAMGGALVLENAEA